MTNYPERKRNRLKNYDYSKNGFYFVTICVDKRMEFFGEIKNAKMILNTCGEIVKQCWNEIPNHFPNVLLDEYIVMPNHVHGIVMIQNDNCDGYMSHVGNKNFCSLQWQTRLSRSLSSIIRGFKIGVIKWCYQNGLDNFSWQKSFHDHIIRNNDELNRIRQYIINNPRNWNLDRNNV